MSASGQSVQTPVIPLRRRKRLWAKRGLWLMTGHGLLNLIGLPLKARCDSGAKAGDHHPAMVLKQKRLSDS